MADTEKQDPRCYADRFTESDQTLGRFDHKAQANITKAQLLDPKYWSHVAERMTPYSEVTCRCDDGTFYAKLLVLDCGRGWANMQLLGWWNLTTADVAQTQSALGSKDDYEIIWKGENRKHVIQRKADQVIIHEGEHRQKKAAEMWLEEYLKGKARKAMPAEQPG